MVCRRLTILRVLSSLGINFNSSMEGLVFFGKMNTSSFAGVAQSVEQRTENPRVDGSIPSPGTPFFEMSCGNSQHAGSEKDKKMQLTYEAC